MIYFLLNTERKTLKIGFTDNDVKSRISNLQTGNSDKLTLIGLIDGDLNLEKFLHNLFSNKCENGEWFNFDNELKDFVTCLNINKNHVYELILQKQYKELENLKNNVERVGIAKTIKHANLPEKIKQKLEKNNLIGKLKRNVKNKFLVLKDDDNYEEFDLLQFKAEFYKDSNIFVSEYKLKQVLILFAEKIEEHNNKFKEKSSFESTFIQHVEDNYISQNKPFVVTDVLKELDVKPSSYVKTAARILKRDFNLTAPEVSIVDGKRGRWWNNQL